MRSKKGIMISDNIDPIHAFFIIVASEDQQSYYLHSLMWIAQIAEKADFEKEWIAAKNDKQLRDIFLKAWKRREIY